MSASQINFDDLSFSLTPASTMFISHGQPDGSWDDGAFLPYGDISISPAACVLNYGQGLFEGMKAQRTKDGNIVLFRPFENGRRLAEGARRFCMPEFPPDRFVEVIKQLVRKVADYVPPYGKGSLYIRPCLWGTGPILGVAPAPSYTFLVYASPVGPYFKAGFKPIKLEITNAYHRAAPKGTGNIKALGNYAGVMLPGKLTKDNGFNECIYLDAREERYIEEVGAANFFCVKGNKLSTPALGSILPGITRKSVMQIASDLLGMEVVDGPVCVGEALAADELFCSGTAAVVSPIGSISYDGRETIFNNFEVGETTRKIYNSLTRLQVCDDPDPFGWVVNVD